MTRMTSLDKLNGIHKEFVDKDDRKLGRGEVDALAAYYGGLSARSKAAVKDRIAEIYRDSSYQAGQKAWFLEKLEAAGLTAAELEGVPQDTSDGFLRMSKEAQFDRIQELEGGDGFAKEITTRSITSGAKNRVLEGLEDFKQDYTRHAQGEPPEFGDESFRAIYFEEGSSGRGKSLVGYAAEVGIYHDEHDVDETVYFNLRGEMLGHVYSGE